MAHIRGDLNGISVKLDAVLKNLLRRDEPAFFIPAVIA